MTFGETVLANLIGALAAAVLAGIVAVAVTGQYTKRQDRRNGKRDRDLATATDLYRAYGSFFATWKAWDYHKSHVPNRKERPLSEERYNALIDQAALVEGTYEGILIRITQENPLTVNEATALWALRMAIKQLREAIREDRPLQWQREVEGPGYRKYKAYKHLTGIVSQVLTDTSGRLSRRRRRSKKTNWYALDQVNSRNPPMDISDLRAKDETLRLGVWVLVAERLTSEMEVVVIDDAAPGTQPTSDRSSEVERVPGN